MFQLQLLVQSSICDPDTILHVHLKPPEKEGEISSSFHHLNSHHLNTISTIINLYLLSEAALDTGGGVLTKTPQTEKGIDYGNDDDDPETGATKPPGNTKASVESSGNQEAGNGATQPPRTTEVSPVPEMGLPKDEASGDFFSLSYKHLHEHTSTNQPIF